ISRWSLLVWSGLCSALHAQSFDEAAVTTVPSGRSDQASAFDINSGKLVLFGGTNGTAALGDTWTYDGFTWGSIVPLQSPSPRSGAGMAPTILSNINMTVLFGGQASAGFLGDTWLWVSVGNPPNWSAVSGLAPTPRAQHAMATDTNGVTILF